MKIFEFIIFLIFFINISIANSKSVFETNFHKIDITDENISKEKEMQINRIKKDSLDNIFNKILIKNDKKKFYNLVDLNYEVDFLIKNIIIENEFISNNIYKSEIKINFDKKEIINLLRIHNINYTDIESPNFLLISSYQDKLIKKGLSKNNEFYTFKKNSYIYLVNYQVPEFSFNDRYIIPLNKILLKDIKSLNKITNKYSTDYAFIFIINKKNLNHYIELNLYDKNKKTIISLETFVIPINKDYHPIIFGYLEEWWKTTNIIDNSKINKITCNIKNYSINELHLINSKINLLSQIESNNIKEIILMNNLQTLSFYGKQNLLFYNLKINGLQIKVNENNQCSIQLIK